MRQTLAFQIAVLYRDFLGYTGEQLKKLGLSFGQMPFLIYTGKHPGCTQAELTRALQLDWGYSQRGLARLAEAGFLVKAYDREKAGNCLHLTDAGENAFQVCHQVFRSWDETRTDCLSDREKETLTLLLGRLPGKESD